VRLPRIAKFLVATRHAFDVVLVDMPAVTTNNAVPLARHTDGVVMVVRAGVTPREVVSEALETVGADRVNCIILNRAKPAAPKWLQKRYGRI
jgi:Mrp family chromosome partitioning ATPase